MTPSKNLWVIPTDKPSRLAKVIDHRIEEFRFNSDFYQKIKFTETNQEYLPQNIYITSDEEIKEGDCVILKSGRLTKAEISQGVLGFKTIDGVAFLYFQEGDKKVILATDQDLIKDGVQSIEYNFLEWFVKNPSCESVDVKKQYITPLGDVVDFCYDNERLNYKIIIPKEEPKQYSKVLSENGNELFFDEQGNLIKEEPKQGTMSEAIKQVIYNQLKQETLEEALEKFSPLKYKGEMNYNKIDMIEFAKLQAEKMYSEEEVLEHLNHLIMMPNSELDKYTDDEEMVTMKWFENFKKK